MTYQLQLQHFTFNGVTIDLYVPDAADVQQWYFQQQADNAAVVFPYWSKVWAAAYAMSLFITAHPHYVVDKKVIEPACGLALPSMVAAKYASHVWCSDNVADAIEVVKQSVNYNAYKHVTTSVFDWEALTKETAADVVLLSDINYEPEKFDALYTMLSIFLHKRCTIMLSTPQRLMAKPFIEQLLPFIVQQESIDVREKDNVITPATVFVLSSLI